MMQKSYRFLLRCFRKVFLDMLDDERVHRKLWMLSNRVPPERDLADHIQTKVGNIVAAKYRIATEQTARFILEQLPDAKAFDTPQDLLVDCVDRIRERPGLLLEFGVFGGMTINLISGRVPERAVHGFDSFQGLPENWRDCPKGAFSSDGVLPKVNANVQLHVGWFNETLPPFVEAHTPFEIALLHIDCDLYSSTQTVFEHVERFIVPGTVIVFDEFFNYPNFQEHEFKAWFEFVERTGIRFKYLGYANELTALAVQVEG